MSRYLSMVGWCGSGWPTGRACPTLGGMRGRKTTWAWSAWVVVLMVISAQVAAQGQPSPPLQVAADGRHLWVLRGERDGSGQYQTAVLHRVWGATDEWNEPDLWLRRVEVLRGRVLPGGATAAAGQAWLVFQDLSVQRLLAEPDPQRGGWRYVGARQATLPQGVTLQGTSAGENGLWALVRADTAEARAAIDRPPAAETRAVVGEARPLPHKRAPLPPQLRDSTDAQPEASPATPPTPAEHAEDVPPEAAPADDAAGPRLLWLHNERWQKVDLPADWPTEARTWLAHHDPHTPRPVLLAAWPIEGGGERLRVYRWRDEAWAARDYTLRGGDGEAVTLGAEVQVSGLASTLVLAQRADAGGASSVRLWALLPEQAVPLATVPLEGEGQLRWALAPFADTLAVLVRSASGPPRGLAWTRINLQGEVVESATALFERKPRPFDRAIEHVLLIGALVVATLIMFVFWRRDPQWNQLDLPATLLLADPLRRAVAGAIDLAPWLYIAGRVFDDRGIVGVIMQWPMLVSRPTWPMLAPAMLAIGLFVAYTTLAELFTARTVGKALTGLRVADLKGQPPNLWQVLIRNAMKALELVAPLLLILPLLGPFRQRLGDLVARTVIVLPRGKDESQDTADEPDPDDQEPPR